LSTETNLLASVIPTKIPLLDDYLGGGLKVGFSYAFWSEVEVDPSALVLQILYNRASEDHDKVIFVCTTKKPRHILQSMRDLGFETSTLEIEFIDAYSSSIPEKSGEQIEPNVYPLSSAKDATELIRILSTRLQSVSKEVGSHVLVVFDSFSAYLDRFEIPVVPSDALAKIREEFAKNNAVGLFVFTQWEYEKDLLEQIKANFDVIIELRSTSDKPVYSMSVQKRGSEIQERRLTYFKILRPGGVKIYIPKVVVTGPFHAGKTSFIHSASKGAVSVDRLGTTVALDFAHVEYKGFLIDIFGTPGQTRFDPLLQKLGTQAFGVIVYVSATDSIGLSRVRQQMRIVKTEHLPYVVAVNKVNLRGAISLAAVRNLMKIPRKIPIIPLRAKNLADVRPNQPCELDPNDVNEVLDKVISQITKAEEANSPSPS
jgi:small GTP-binding protein